MMLVYLCDERTESIYVKNVPTLFISVMNVPNLFISAVGYVASFICKNHKFLFTELKMLLTSLRYKSPVV